MGLGQLTYTVLGLYDYESDPEKAAEIVWDSMYGRNNAANGGVMRTSVVGLWNENTYRPKMYWLQCSIWYGKGGSCHLKNFAGLVTGMMRGLGCI